MGFYRGFLTTSLGVLPSQLVYLSTLESLRYSLPHLDSPRDQVLRSFVAGSSASLAASVFSVPLEVVSQRLMVCVMNSASFQRTGQARRTLPVFGWYRGVQGDCEPGGATRLLSRLHHSDADAGAFFGSPAAHPQAFGGLHT